MPAWHIRPWFSRVLAVVLAATAPLAHADASTLWAPDAADRHRLVLLADEAGLAVPLNHWPLPRDGVVRALDALPSALPPALDDARGALRRALAAQEHARLSLIVRTPHEALSGFAADARPGRVELRAAPWRAGGAVLQVGARIDRQDGEWRLRADDSVLAVEALGVQLQAWSHRAWWGPGWQSSLLLGHNAPPLPGAGVQRASTVASDHPWLAWMGPWSAEVFVARLDRAGGAYLMGNRITLRPWPALEIGLGRTAQWGAHGRPRSLRSFVRTLLGESTNVIDPALAPQDPANGLAGIDLRLRCPAGLRCAAYMQWIGEDEAGWAPSKFLALAGLESWSADGRHRVLAEWAHTACRGAPGQTPVSGCAYRHHAYPEGYTHDRRWLGAGAGPDSKLLTLGWLDAQRDLSLRLHAGTIGSRVGRRSALTGDPQHAGHVVGAGGHRSVRWGAATLRGELDWMRIRAADGERTEARIGFEATWTFAPTP